MEKPWGRGCLRAALFMESWRDYVTRILRFLVNSVLKSSRISAFTQTQSDEEDIKQISLRSTNPGLWAPD